MPTVLLVDTDSEECAAYAEALSEVTERVYTAPSFPLAKSALVETRPDVLVTQVRLSEFNGIHLALWGRGRLPSLRVVIVGQSDPNLETEARTSGFFYLRYSDEQAIVQATLEAIAREHPRRRWQRKQLPLSLAGHIDGTPALVLDVGYGGLRMQVLGPFHAEPDSRLPVNIPALEVDVETTCRWVTSDKASGSYACGVSLAEADTHAGSRWRALVDALTPTL
jgi:CheY-like chemotaxis protein